MAAPAAAQELYGYNISGNIGEALATRIKDPLWLLARQWQSGRVRGGERRPRCRAVDCRARAPYRHDRSRRHHPRSNVTGHAPRLYGRARGETTGRHPRGKTRRLSTASAHTATERSSSHVSTTVAISIGTISTSPHAPSRAAAARKRSKRVWSRRRADLPRRTAPTLVALRGWRCLLRLAGPTPSRTCCRCSCRSSSCIDINNWYLAPAPMPAG